MRPLLVADLFCGAGGSSTGAKKAIDALGRRMLLTCVNHWDRAIETHTRMHPEARHHCMDVASARPIELVPEGRLDLLMASPTCTYHSRARGGRPTSDQQRMDPWHVVTWLTELDVRRVLIENVPEFVDWGPVDPRTGRPIKAKRGQYFREWIATLERLGYRVEWKILNCADYGDATTRRRFFLLGRKRGKVKWPEPTHAKDPAHDLLAPRKKWRAARECIDWELRGKSIFDRKVPLAARTIQRIYAGAVRFGWPEPFIVVLRNHMDARSIDVPLPTIAANGTHVGLAQPIIIRSDTHGAKKLAARSPEDPVQTIVGSGGIGIAEPFVLSQASGGAARGVFPTFTTGGRQGEGTVLITPYYGSGSGKNCKSVEEPLDTVTTLDRFGMVVPVTHAGGNTRADTVDLPIRTITTARRGELAFITASFGERDGQLPRTHDLALPMPTIPAQGSVRMAEAAAEGERYDILFRMLHWRELARAMSFSDAEQAYEFAGTKTEITKQIGNAVPVNMARALVGAALWDLEVA